MKAIIPTRQVITPKDYSNFAGCSERNARLVLQKARLSLNKDKHQPLTAREFCSYIDVDYSEMEPFLKMA